MNDIRRLFILGDAHINSAGAGAWDRIIEDINQYDPHAVLILGDLSGGKDTGSNAALAFSTRTLNRLRAPWLSVIGNHDLQSTDFSTDEEAVASMLRHFGRPEPWFEADFGPLAVIGLSNTRWRQNQEQPNEVVIVPEQMAWLRRQLANIADRPVLILSHVPPLGSDLLLMPELHARVGNGYLNQNHQPGQLMQIVWENPNILFWFSAHNHLGQHYRSAISQRLGAWFVHTGAAVGTRDGYRHSRVLEIGSRGFLLRTFDHGLRKFDSTLDFRHEVPLARIVAGRKRLAGQRFVPYDPETMRQEWRDGSDPEHERFVFLSDAHGKEDLFPVQERIIEWARRQVIRHSPDRLVLGGDLTHQPSPSQAATFLKRLAPGSTPTYYLPGNNEGPEFGLAADAKSTVEFTHGCRAGKNRVFFLETTSREQAGQALEEFLSLAPPRQSCLVFAHFPPQAIAGQAMELLSRREAHTHWVCGHAHTGKTQAGDNWTVYYCGGLDPVKVRGSRPEILVLDWDGDRPRIQRLPVPAGVLLPPTPRRLDLGLSCSKNPAEEILKAGLDNKIAALQFKLPKRPEPKLPSRQALALAERHRREIPGSFLSVHLPGAGNSNGDLNLKALDDCLDWGECLGVDDFTIHLPAVPVARMFNLGQEYLANGWAAECLDFYRLLASRTIAGGAGLSIENIYNKNRCPDTEEVLSSRPWHLTRFIDQLRGSLLAHGLPRRDVERTGILLDVGHAFRDVKVSKLLGLADWIGQTGEYLQLAHIHQVGNNGKEKINHQEVGNPHGPYINFQGVFDLLDEHVAKPIPLLIEVRDLAPALASWRILRNFDDARTFMLGAGPNPGE